MLTIVKASDTSKLNTGFYRFSSISNGLRLGSDNTVPVIPFESLTPSSELLNKYNAGEIKKSEFCKEYTKALKSKSALFELNIIANTFETGKNMYKAECFIIADDEWEIGYHKALIKTIKKRYGLKFEPIKDLNKEIKKDIKDAITKKMKKKEITKAVRKVLKRRRANVELSYEGQQQVAKENKYYAIERLVAEYHVRGAIVPEGTKYKRGDNFKKVVKEEKIVKAIGQSCENKKHEKIITKIAKNNDFKLTKKKLLKMNKKQLVQILMMCYTGLTSSRDS